MTREDTTIYKGKEYVTVIEFAKRVGSCRRTILNAVNAGKLQSRTFDGRRALFIEWETGKTIWDMIPHDRSKSKAGKASAASKYGKTDSEAKTPAVSEPTVESPEADLGNAPDIIDLSSFDKTKYADCVLPNGEFDYDKLKLRLTAETYQQKLQKERGQLVEKTEVVDWAKRLGTLLNSGLESIPQKYTSVLLAQVQTIVAQRLDSTFEFTEKERTDLRNVLKGCGPEIMKSMKTAIMEMQDE